jgi:transcription antitermination factor NusG
MGEACQFESTLGVSTTPAFLFLKEGGATFPWYALKVRVGGEGNVVRALCDRGLNHYCPTRKERRSYTDRMKVVTMPVFPGYVFCSFDIAKKLPVISCPGVDYIVGIAGVPTPIPEVQIESIRRMIAAGAVASEQFVAGDRVRVTHGALEGVEGLLIREPHGNRLVVSIDLLNRAASLFVDQDQIEVLPLRRTTR